MPPLWPGRASSNTGWTAGFCVPDTASHSREFRCATCYSADHAAIPAIVEWYRRRNLTPRLAIADRLLRITGIRERANRMLVCDVRTAEPDPSVRLSARPDEDWLRLYQRRIPDDVLTAVVGGELVFGRHADVVGGRASVTDAPDGTRWVGLSAIQVPDSHRDAGRALVETLLAWGAAHGATRGYVRILDGDNAAASSARSLGFTLHHHACYVTVGT